MDRTYNINNSQLTIKFGNILDSEADVIVSSDDYRLSMGGGISRMILIGAGPEMKIDAKKKVPASLGDVVVTTAGLLPQKFIFHAITIDRTTLSRLDETNKDDIQQYIIHHAVKKVFRLMAVLNVNTVAFPAIGAGVAHIPYDKVAKCMGEAFAEALSETNKSYKVELYLYDRYGKMGLWDYMPFFESFAKAEIYDSSNTKIIHEEVENEYNNVIIKKADELNGEVARIFISYSRKDYSKICGICDLLNKMEIPYWIDLDGTYSGENYKAVIVDAIEKADLLLFISSVNSNASSNVAKEISIADKFKKTILPIRIDDTPYSSVIEYDLIGIDYIDYNNRSDSLEKLRKSILARLLMTQQL